MLQHSRSCWTQQQIWRTTLRSWDMPGLGCTDSTNSASFEYLHRVITLLHIIYTIVPPPPLGCTVGFCMLDHSFWWECTANEQVEALREERMVDVLTVEFYCGKLDQPCCPLLQSSYELLGKNSLVAVSCLFLLLWSPDLGFWDLSIHDFNSSIWVISFEKACNARKMNNSEKCPQHLRFGQLGSVG